MGLAFLITTENLQLLSERKVLKEAEYSALLDASAVVGAARNEARRIVQQATSQAEEAQRAGYEEGLRRAKAEYAEQLVSESIAAERQLQSLRSTMAHLVVKAVSQFIADADPRQLFEAALLRVESLLRTEPFITVRVAPAQEAAMRQVLTTLREEAHWGMNLSLSSDPSLQEGACVVQTASGTLEIGVEAQLEAFRRAVERSGMAQQPPAKAAE
ncbi:type III secretion system stator protein SctL [Caldimonas brevitalea]|uniref:Flagellar assembly protein FliH n=1 Tax=Caldimonas brevitalea TaxID=413882 RepID=A0A0G3BVM3_9BURK|nr:type III secretion system stator protein SctL [Caldimonas brevitalea]AKJ32078.1 type III secretion protein [Caldimonas brevitalea]